MVIGSKITTKTHHYGHDLICIILDEYNNHGYHIYVTDKGRVASAIYYTWGFQFGSKSVINGDIFIDDELLNNIEPNYRHFFHCSFGGSPIWQ